MSAAFYIVFGVLWLAMATTVVQLKRSYDEVARTRSIAVAWALVAILYDDDAERRGWVRPRGRARVDNMRTLIEYLAAEHGRNGRVVLDEVRDGFPVQP